MKYSSVGFISNCTKKDIVVYLEMCCEEIVVSPKQTFELLIEDIAEALPVTINYYDGSIQIYPHSSNPEWLIIFNGKEIKPSHPTILKKYE